MIINGTTHILESFLRDKLVSFDTQGPQIQVALAVGEQMIVAVRMKEHPVHLLLVLEHFLHFGHQPIASPIVAVELQVVV